MVRKGPEKRGVLTRRPDRRQLSRGCGRLICELHCLGPRSGPRATRVVTLELYVLPSGGGLPLMESREKRITHT
jgi:hypothetical protein